MSKSLHPDGTPRIAESGGEQYGQCVRCDECKRIWYWKNVWQLNGRNICEECERREE